MRENMSYPASYSTHLPNPPHQTNSEAYRKLTWENDSKRRATNDKASRYCHICGIKSTPEWRSGPQGRATLCNACGLRYAKKFKAGSADSEVVPALRVEVVREQSSVLSVTKPQTFDEGNAPYSEPLASVAKRMAIQRLLNLP